MKTQAQIDAKKAYQAKWRAENAEKRAADNRRWREANAESVRLKKAAYHAANAESIRVKKADKYLENVEAERAKRVKFRQDNPEKIRVAKKASYARHRDVVLARATEYRATNQEAIQASKVRNKPQADAYTRRYRDENRETLNKMHREWHAAHPEVRLAASSRYRAKKLNANPSWDTELTNLVTKEAAALCRARLAATGFAWNVDHVVPLQGRYVSGFHVWNNLAVIPAIENRRKLNRFQPQ